MRVFFNANKCRKMISRSNKNTNMSLFRKKICEKLHAPKLKKSIVITCQFKSSKIIWKENIDSRIIGEIYQVDLYKNGRLQYAFNTENNFQIIDKNGNLVKKIKNKNRLGLTVFDYDKVKNYRFLLFDKEIKILDSKMKNVKGFNKKNIKGIQRKNPKHFRIGNKDYLIFNVNNKLKITDRRGNIRIKNDLNNIENEIFLNQNNIRICRKSRIESLPKKDRKKFPGLLRIRGFTNFSKESNEHQRIYNRKMQGGSLCLHQSTLKSGKNRIWRKSGFF